MSNIREEYQEVSTLYKQSEAQLNEVTAEIKVKRPMVDKIKTELAAKGIVFEKLEELQAIFDKRSGDFTTKVRAAKAQLSPLTNPSATI
jgi:UDP-N-acetylglucosamine pyrophosphorylase